LFVIVTGGAGGLVVPTCRLLLNVTEAGVSIADGGVEAVLLKQTVTSSIDGVTLLFDVASEAWYLR
jgi:hypothetical protein